MTVAGALPAAAADPAREPVDAGPTAVRWVDERALTAGDGTAAAPWKRLPAELPAGTEVRLAPGLYRGPFRLAPGTRLVGSGAAVLFLEGAGTVVEATDARLEGVSVQGGAVGVAAWGRVEATQVHFSGHRTAGAQVERTGAFACSGCVFEGAVDGSVGVRVRGGAVTLNGATVRQGWRHVVDAEDASVSVTKMTVEGAGTAVHAVRGSARAQDVTVAAGRGAAFFVTHGEMTLERVTVRGHEYGLLAGVGSRVTVNGLEVRRSQLAGVSLVQSESTVRHLVLDHPGSQGGVEAIGGSLVLEDAQLRDVDALGVFAKQVRVAIRRLSVAGVRQVVEPGITTQGDGVHLRECDGLLEDVTVTGAEGVGLWATAESTLTVSGLVVEDAGNGALGAERNTRITGAAARVTRVRGAAVVALDTSIVRLEHLTVAAAPDGVVWADCTEGAEVVVGELSGNAPVDRLACLTVFSEPGRDAGSTQKRLPGGRR